MSNQSDLLQGTLDLLIMQTIALEPMHGWAITQRIQQVSTVTQSPAGLALSRALPTGVEGLDPLQVGQHRQQPPRQVLFPHRRRQAAARNRNREMEAAVGGCEPRASGNVEPRHALLASDHNSPAGHRPAPAQRDRDRTKSCACIWGGRSSSGSPPACPQKRHADCHDSSLEASSKSRRTAATRAASGCSTIWLATPRHGVRRLVRDWQFTTAAVLILALGIGANTAIFSVVNAALFREQVFDRDRLVEIYQRFGDSGSPGGNTYPAYLDMAAYTDVFAATTAVLINGALFQGNEGLRTAIVEYTTPSYLSVLGLRPSRGRWFDSS